MKAPIKIIIVENSTYTDINSYLRDSEYIKSVYVFGLKIFEKTRTSKDLTTVTISTPNAPVSNESK